jgi:hypothetical protein
MITPTVIILLELLFSDGTSHPVKATSGSLVVSGCGCRYGNSAQHLTILHFPSLHAEAVPHGGIFTPADIVPLLFFYVLLFGLSLLCFEARVTDSVLKNGASRRDAHGFAFQSDRWLSNAFFQAQKSI